MAQINPLVTPGASATESAVIPAHPFYNLPAELMLHIVDLLPPESFINFAFANYSLFLANGLAPALSSKRIAIMMRRTDINRHFSLLPFPAELNLQIMSLLKPIDIMRFVIANYQEVERQGIAPKLTVEIISRLQSAITQD